MRYSMKSVLQCYPSSSLVLVSIGKDRKLPSKYAIHIGIFLTDISFAALT